MKKKFNLFFLLSFGIILILTLVSIISEFKTTGPKTEDIEIPWKENSKIENGWEIASIQRHNEFIRIEIKKDDLSHSIEITYKHKKPGKFSTKNYMVQPSPNSKVPDEILKMFQDKIAELEKENKHKIFVKKSEDRKAAPIPWKVNDQIGKWKIENINKHNEYIRLSLNSDNAKSQIEIKYNDKQGESKFSTKFYLIQPAPGDNAVDDALVDVLKEVKKIETDPNHKPFVTRMKKEKTQMAFLKYFPHIIFLISIIGIIYLVIRNRLEE